MHRHLQGLLCEVTPLLLRVVKLHNDLMTIAVACLWKSVVSWHLRGKTFSQLWVLAPFLAPEFYIQHQILCCSGVGPSDLQVRSTSHIVLVKGNSITWIWVVMGVANVHPHLFAEYIWLDCPDPFFYNTYLHDFATRRCRRWVCIDSVRSNSVFCWYDTPGECIYYAYENSPISEQDCCAFSWLGKTWVGRHTVCNQFVSIGINSYRLFQKRRCSVKKSLHKWLSRWDWYFSVDFWIHTGDALGQNMSPVRNGWSWWCSKRSRLLRAGRSCVEKWFPPSSNQPTQTVILSHHHDCNITASDHHAPCTA